jgi:hypothetical protein
VDINDLRTEAERRLWAAFPHGESVNLGDGLPTADGFEPDDWDATRTIRAEVINRLLLGAVDPARGHIAKVDLAGARIVDAIDLNGGETGQELLLARCWLDAAPDLTDARTRGIWITACYLPGLTADRLAASGALSLESCIVAGSVQLRGAHISGQLDLSGASLDNPDGDALAADRLVVDGDMFGLGGFSAVGQVSMIGAHISRTLNLGGASLSNPDGDALAADLLRVDGSVFFRYGFGTSGPVRLLGAHVGGQLDLSGASLSCPDGDALAADGLVVGGDMFCREGFRADGQFGLLGAHIGGQLDMTGASLSNTGGGDALAADRLRVGGSMFCRNGFSAVGQVGLFGARVGGQLDLSGASLSNPGGLALDCEEVQAKRLRLDAAVEGWVDLSQAEFGVLELPQLRGQPPMRLNGLSYTDLDPDPDPPVRVRLAWLRRDPAGYHPQPYEQLAAYYRSIGHERDANVVLLKKRRAYRRHRYRHWPAPLRWLAAPVVRVPGLLVDALSGYGFVPVRAFCWLLVALAGGWLALRDASLSGPTTSAGVNTLLLVVDTVVPTSPFGMEGQVSLHGSALAWSMGLQVLGYALSIAILPAITRALGSSST